MRLANLRHQELFGCGIDSVEDQLATESTAADWVTEPVKGPILVPKQRETGECRF
jgi:hypothetical protein